MSFEAFFSQGGYGFFVWGAYGMALVALSIECIALNLRHKLTIAHIQRIIRRNTLVNDQ